MSEQNDIRFRILVVDDDPGLLEPLSEFLTASEYSVVTAASGEEAQSIVTEQPFDLVLTDISMGEVSGIDLLEAIKQHNEEIDVIMMTGYLEISFAIDAMRQGAYDFFTKPFNFEKIALTIERVREKQGLKDDARRYHLLKREQELQLETTLSLARAAEERDRCNIGHGKRVAAYAVRLGKKLCFTEDKLTDLKLAGLLHDVGKIGIDDAILNKPGKLTETERLQMNRHSEIAEYILKPISVLKDLSPAVRWHHERYDGTGYPDGISGDDIPLDARIICIVDFFDAITSVRPYRDPMPLEKALGLVAEESGKMFDPMLAKLFIEMMQPGKVPQEA